MSADNYELMRSVIQRIATGPTMSKDLPAEEARQAMRWVLEGEADEVQAGIFLIALRMKRETDDELAGILAAIRDGMPTRSLAVDELVCVADPYDGCLRGTPVSAFLPAVLAACGLRVLSHGVEVMGPKFGASHAKVLRAAGRATDHSLEAAAERIENDECGWSYLDQSVLAPELAALTDLRSRIVKRPCLTTVEAALCPFEARKARHLVTGFVHTGYPEIYARLANTSGFASSVLVRGVEGSVVPSLAQAARYITSTDGDKLNVVDIDPTELDMCHEVRALPLPRLAKPVSEGARSIARENNPGVALIAEEGAKLGLEVLGGNPGMAHDALVYSGAIVLCATGKADSLLEGADRVRGVLQGGSALAHFSA